MDWTQQHVDKKISSSQQTKAAKVEETFVFVSALFNSVSFAYLQTYQYDTFPQDHVGCTDTFSNWHMFTGE